MQPDRISRLPGGAEHSPDAVAVGQLKGLVRGDLGLPEQVEHQQSPRDQVFRRVLKDPPDVLRVEQVVQGVPGARHQVEALLRPEGDHVGGEKGPLRHLGAGDIDHPLRQIRSHSPDAAADQLPAQNPGAAAQIQGPADHRAAPFQKAEELSGKDLGIDVPPELVVGPAKGAAVHPAPPDPDPRRSRPIFYHFLPGAVNSPLPAASCAEAYIFMDYLRDGSIHENGIIFILDIDTAGDFPLQCRQSAIEARTR